MLRGYTHFGTMPFHIRTMPVHARVYAFWAKADACTGVMRMASICSTIVYFKCGKHCLAAGIKKAETE